MTFTIKECSENSIVLRPRLELYQVRDYMGQSLPGLAIVLDKVDGEEIEQFAVLTVSFGDFISAKNCAYVDLNNCTFAPILLEHGVARDTGLKKTSGYCAYPLWQFDAHFLQEIGNENYQKYADAYTNYMNGMLDGDECDEEDEDE